MTVITFDTLKHFKNLKAAGFVESQAEALIELQRDLHTSHLSELATKEDLNRGLKELKLEVTAEIAPLKWGVAMCAAGITALLLKSFFPH